MFKKWRQWLGNLFNRFNSKEKSMENEPDNTNADASEVENAQASDNPLTESLNQLKEEHQRHCNKWMQEHLRAFPAPTNKKAYADAMKKLTSFHTQYQKALKHRLHVETLAEKTQRPPKNLESYREAAKKIEAQYANALFSVLLSTVDRRLSHILISAPQVKQPLSKKQFKEQHKTIETIIENYKGYYLHAVIRSLPSLEKWIDSEAGKKAVNDYRLSVVLKADLLKNELNIEKSERILYDRLSRLNRVLPVQPYKNPDASKKLNASDKEKRQLKKVLADVTTLHKTREGIEKAIQKQRAMPLSLLSQEAAHPRNLSQRLVKFFQINQMRWQDSMPLPEFDINEELNLRDGRPLSRKEWLLWVTNKIKSRFFASAIPVKKVLPAKQPQNSVPPAKINQPAPSLSFNDIVISYQKNRPANARLQVSEVGKNGKEKRLTPIALKQYKESAIDLTSQVALLNAMNQELAQLKEENRVMDNFVDFYNQTIGPMEDKVIEHDHQLMELNHQLIEHAHQLTRHDHQLMELKVELKQLTSGVSELKSGISVRTNSLENGVQHTETYGIDSNQKKLDAIEERLNQLIKSLTNQNNPITNNAPPPSQEENQKKEPPGNSSNFFN